MSPRPPERSSVIAPSLRGPELPRPRRRSLRQTQSPETKETLSPPCRALPGDRWAREEFESAITKRIEQGIRIIPVLYEPCERPELVRALRYVDCADHREAEFERQFLDIIDTLNEIEMNPYRRA